MERDATTPVIYPRSGVYFMFGTFAGLLTGALLSLGGPAPWEAIALFGAGTLVLALAVFFIGHKIVGRDV